MLTLSAFAAWGTAAQAAEAAQDAAAAQSPPAPAASSAAASPSTPSGPSAPAAQATTSLADLVVTARRRAENLQRVPVSMTALGPEALARASSTNVTALAQVVPGLSIFTPSDPNNHSFAIRGQQFTFGTLFPAVIAYFAEVPVQRVSDGSFLDLSNVQVLKGPQGTLFGRVTDGGAILLTPAKPTNQYGGYLQAGLGNYNQRAVEGVVNIPIVSGKVLLRVSGEVNRRDGYTYNLFDGKKLDDLAYEVGRVSLILRPTDWLENYTVFNYNHASQNGNSAVLTAVNPAAVITAGNTGVLASMQAQLAAQNARGPRVVNEGGPTALFGGADGITYKRLVNTVVNTATVDFGGAFKLKNITGYVYNRERSGIIAGTGPGYYESPNNFLPRYDQFYEQVSNETQLQGKLWGDRLDTTTGVYFDRQKVPGPAEQFYFLYGRLQLSQQQYPVTTSKAAYTQFGLKILDGLKFDGGVRYTQDHVSADTATYISFTSSPTAIPHGQCLTTNAGYPSAIVSLACVHSDATFGVWTYTLGADYQLTPNMFLYASRRRGYRPGGFNATSNAKVASYAPEFDTSNEIGIKADWRLGDMKARTNLSAFLDDYTNIQQQLSISVPGGAPFTALTNVAAAKIKGFDFDGTLVPLPGLTLNLSWTYLDAHYDASKYSASYIAAACPANMLTTVADPGKFCPLLPLKVAPRDQANAGVRYQLPVPEDVGVVTIGTNLSYTSPVYESGNVPYGTVAAHTIYNADATWNSIGGRPVDLHLFVNNLTNKTYMNSITNFTSNGSLGIAFAFYAPPRLYGMSVRYHF